MTENNFTLCWWESGTMTNTKLSNKKFTFTKAVSTSDCTQQIPGIATKLFFDCLVQCESGSFEKLVLDIFEQNLKIKVIDELRDDFQPQKC